MQAFQSILLLLPLGFGLSGPSGQPSHDDGGAGGQLAAPVEAEPAHAGHEHQDAEASAQLAWRFVTHYGCGWTGRYLVNVPAYNTLQCFGCGFLFTCYIW